MATLDEIFAAMPDEAAGGTHELLVIDADTREIYVPDSEILFGVEHDGNAETKYFQCPRYVGKGIDLAACFMRINFQNANGERDGYLVKDTTSDSENIYFSWELWPKVTQYKGTVQFVLCASLPGSTKTADWHTTLAQGNVLEGLEPDAEVVAAASSDLIAQLLATVAAQEANVEAVGAEQVQTVQAAAKAAQEAAVAEIEAKKQNTLAEIPDDYTAMAAQVDTLARTTAGAIVCQAEGAAIQVANASNHPLPGLRIFGRSTQDGTPTPDNPVEIVSTPAPTVTVCGKNLFDSSKVNQDYVVSENELHITPTTYNVDIYTGIAGSSQPVPSNRIANLPHLPKGTYSVSFEMTFDDGTEHNQYMVVTEINADGSVKGQHSVLSGGVFTLQEGTLITLRRSTNAAATIKNLQIEAGNTATKYEPYTGGTVTLANGLPGIPVASGGNYTDADGQQWICDEVDLARGVYVHRLGHYIFDGSTDEAWDGVYTHDSKHYVRIKVPRGSAQYTTPLFCNYSEMASWARDVICFINNFTEFIVGGNPMESVLSSVATFREYLASNPIELVYMLENPTESPLSETELAACRALHSVKPTTTILNDSGAHMAVEYVADTKLYIDGKLAELVAAMNA